MLPTYEEVAQDKRLVEWRNNESDNRPLAQVVYEIIKDEDSKSGIVVDDYFRLGMPQNEDELFCLISKIINSINKGKTHLLDKDIYQAINSFIEEAAPFRLLPTPTYKPHRRPTKLGSIEVKSGKNELNLDSETITITADPSSRICVEKDGEPQYLKSLTLELADYGKYLNGGKP